MRPIWLAVVYHPLKSDAYSIHHQFLPNNWRICLYSTLAAWRVCAIRCTRLGWYTLHTCAIYRRYSSRWSTQKCRRKLQAEKEAIDKPRRCAFTRTHFPSLPPQSFSDHLPLLDTIAPSPCLTTNCIPTAPHARI